MPRRGHPLGDLSVSSTAIRSAQAAGADCSDLALVVAPRAGDPDAATARLPEEHLQECPDCSPLYAALVGVGAGQRDAATMAVR